MKNIGIDIVRNERFKEMLVDEKKYSRILSAKEIEVFRSFNSEKRKLEYLASRFAAKEALVKALSKTKISFNYTDVSVLNEENGAPYVEFAFKTDIYVLISISHTEDDSIAFVILI
jgi:holo-[acyl-carrier protein] synthase